MKRNKSTLFLFALINITLITYCMEPKSKHIVVDIDFFVQPNSTAAAKEIGVLGICSALVGSMMGGPKIDEALPDFFNLLRIVDPAESPKPITWKKHAAPVQLYDSVSGRRSSAEILRDTTKGIKENSGNNLMQTFAKITFDPETNTKVMQIIASAVVLLEELRKHNNTLHLLGNWNPEALPHLRKKFPDEFNLFNGHIITSGTYDEKELVKGPAMYRKFFEVSKAQPENTTFIESDEHHIRDIQGLFPQSSTILYTPHDLKLVRAQLQKHGALTKN